MINSFLNFVKRFNIFFKYCLIGVTGVFLDFAVFYLLNKKLGIYYQIANIISVSSGITNNFFLNAYFNFKITDHLFKRFLHFFAIGLFGLLLSALLLYIMIEKFHFEVLITKIIVIFIVAVVQFLLNLHISFKKKIKHD